MCDKRAGFGTEKASWATARAHKADLVGALSRAKVAGGAGVGKVDLDGKIGHKENLLAEGAIGCWWAGCAGINLPVARLDE